LPSKKDGSESADDGAADGTRAGSIACADAPISTVTANSEPPAKVVLLAPIYPTLPSAAIPTAGDIARTNFVQSSERRDDGLAVTSPTASAASASPATHPSPRSAAKQFAAVPRELFIWNIKGLHGNNKA
jgi:hypothetical protein